MNDVVERERILAGYIGEEELAAEFQVSVQTCGDGEGSDQGRRLRALAPQCCIPLTWAASGYEAMSSRGPKLRRWHFMRRSRPPRRR